MKIRFNKLLIFSCFLTFFITRLALAGPSLPLNPEAVPKNDTGVKKLLDRLTGLGEPVSREAAGLLTVQAPGERYRLSFRLIARGPEAWRMEIFDPFGRPMLYLVSFQGTIRLFSIPQKKEIPFILPSSEPWSSFSQIPLMEISKIFWGRVPLFPYDTYQSTLNSEKGQEKIKFDFHGSVHQVIWITQNPFSVTQSRISSLSKEGEIEILFSDFSEITGNRIPMRCEIKEGTGEQALTLLYETVVQRVDIADEIFTLPQLPKTPSL